MPYGRIGSICLPLRAVVFMLLSLNAVSIRAEDSAPAMFSFSGFGTVGAVHSSEHNADYATSVYRPEGAGHSRNWSADVDTRIGAQVSAQFSPQLSAILQVVSEQRYDNSYMPSVEWANLKYRFTPDLDVRIGRSILPIFLASDYYKVGYAYPWVRPPLEMYRLLPATREDGIFVGYRSRLGEWNHAVQANVGWDDLPLPHNGGTTKARRGWGVTDTAEYGAFTLRMSYQRALLTIPPFNPLFDAFRLFGLQGNAIADRYDTRDKLNDVFCLGASYDPGAWFVMGEWGISRSHAVIGDNSAWYLSGGYRVGNLTPYLSYSRIDARSNTSDSGLDTTVLPPPAVPAAIGLNAALNGILGILPVQHTISVGTRWDFMKNVDFKVQFDHSSLGAGSPGLLLYPQPGFQPGGTVNIFSAAIDFVF